MPGSIDERLNAVERLLALFRMERLAYLTVTGIALAMLIGSGAYLIVQKQGDIATITGLFGSSGLITVALARLLRMWDQAISMIMEQKIEVN